MLVHLTDVDIRRYVAGIPDEQVGRHVRRCLFCAERLADAAQRNVRWERRGILGRLVRIEYAEEIEELLAEIEEGRRHAA
jgi:hypothetical protein